MMDWMARACDLPSFFIFEDSNGVGGGSTQCSASDSIFNSIIAARHLRLKEAGCFENPPRESIGSVLTRLVAFTSIESHSCVQKGAQLALCRMHLLTPDNIDDKITGYNFESAVRDEEKQGFTPFYMCATIGSTCSCAIDDVEDIGIVCQKYKIYLHVDAAYAGSAFIVDKFRYLKKGIEYADSLDINPYKLMMAAPDLGCLWVKNTKEYKEPWAINATYLLNEFESDPDPKVKLNYIEYRDYGVPLSRRMRSLKLWFLFRIYGVTGLQAYIIRLCDAAKHFESLVRADHRFEVVNPVHLALVCFRQRPYG